jgi:hypothetical protein
VYNLENTIRYLNYSKKIPNLKNNNPKWILGSGDIVDSKSTFLGFFLAMDVNFIDWIYFDRMKIFQLNQCH